METEKPALVDCDLCGTSPGMYGELQQYPAIEICSKCGFLYVPCRRPSKEIADAWANVFGEGYTSAWPAVKARLTYVAEWIDVNFELDGKSVLDIGAGEGEFLRMAYQRGAEPYAIEPSRKNVKRIMEHRIQCFFGTLEEYDSPTKFDMITVLWTLENCGDCIGFLRKAKSLLKPDGKLIVATGSRILVPFKKNLSEYFGTQPADLHCFRFSRNSLTHALAAAGFAEATHNRYQDSDCLVVAAWGDADPKADHSVWYDDPQEVQKHFDKWERTWP